MVGFGTYKIGFVPASSNTAGQPGHSPDQDPKEIIKDAIATGYRYIDCAQFYGNEAMVGAAIAECGVPRNELFIVSKVWCDKIYEGREAIIAQLDKTLEDLQVVLSLPALLVQSTNTDAVQVDCVDVYLIRMPTHADVC
jgi:diketogulonate reductase-like aldo/keto reductase